MTSLLQQDSSGFLSSFALELIKGGSEESVSIADNQTAQEEVSDVAESEIKPVSLCKVCQLFISISKW